MPNPFTELKVLIRLQPVIKQFQNEVHMKLSVNMIVQLIGTALQALNIITPMLSPKGQATAAATVALMQAVAAYAAHFSNPDGTAATTPYVPQEKK